MALAASQGLLALGPLAGQLPKLIARLAKYKLTATTAALGGLLTVPDNHASTIRIEVLCHLAAIFCRGAIEPSSKHIREWLDLLVDSVGHLEDPVEDVFVSNVATGLGNKRIFEGIWEANDFYLQSCLAVLTRLQGAWISRCLQSVGAILKLSDEIAERAKISRFLMSDKPPRRKIRLSTQTMRDCVSRVTFDFADLARLRVSPVDLEPFIFKPTHAEMLSEQTLGHTELERRPLIVDTKTSVVLALPTAISAAVRRFIVESAVAASAGKLFQQELVREQFATLFDMGRVGWNIEVFTDPTENLELGIHEFVGTFDVSSYIHVIFVHDFVEEAAQQGLQGMQAVLGKLDTVINDGSATLSGRSDYRKGMTLLIHGGLGRGFAGGFGKAPRGWQNLGMSLHDFMLLSFDHDFSALRAWKLLEQEDEMENRSAQLMNPFGFLNFCGYADSQNFQNVPPDMNEGKIFITSDWVAPLRRRLRQTFDYHVALSAHSDSWIEVQRQGAAVFFKEMEYQPIYVSARFAATGILVGCMETSTRPWWVECAQRSSDQGIASLIYQVWDMTLNWMFRVAPELEKRFSGFPPGPIGMKLIFSDISKWAFDIRSEGNITAPTITVENRTVTIDCICSYLRSFRDATNIGDKMMIAGLIEGASRLCSTPLTSIEAKSLAELWYLTPMPASCIRFQPGAQAS
jgi:hypothetical protein